MEVETKKLTRSVTKKFSLHKPGVEEEAAWERTRVNVAHAIGLTPDCVHLFGSACKYDVVTGLSWSYYGADYAFVSAV
jgi:hypothetical protein